MVTAACAGAACAVGAWAPAPALRHHQVLIRGLVFQTALLNVAPGDTVTWTNRDIVPHTVTGVNGRWNSGNIASQASWTRVISAADTGQYFCQYHPTMRAALARR